MKEISLHVLDIAFNSVAAGADLVRIEIDEDTARNVFDVTISDDGRGMDRKLLETAADPFTTTRDTRKVGLGIPLFKQAAELTGGDFRIDSRPGSGTTVFARFVRDSVDRMPLGDIAGTLVALVSGSAGVDFEFRHSLDGRSYEVSTREIRKALQDDAAFGDPEVVGWLREYVQNQESNLYMERKDSAEDENP